VIIGIITEPITLMLLGGVVLHQLETEHRPCQFQHPDHIGLVGGVGDVADVDTLGENGVFYGLLFFCEKLTQGVDSLKKVLWRGCDRRRKYVLV
jgi:hypothetical protein